MNVPVGQGVGALEPRGQKKPAPQSALVDAVLQYLPTAHGFAVEFTLASAVQKPAAHAAQAPIDVAVEPPAEYVPAAHGFVVPLACPAPHQ